MSRDNIREGRVAAERAWDRAYETIGDALVERFERGYRQAIADENHLRQCTAAECDRCDLARWRQTKIIEDAG